MGLNKDLKTNVQSSTSISEIAQSTPLCPTTKNELAETFVELAPFSTGMLIYNYFLYTLWSVLSIATIGGIFCAPAWAAILCFCISYMRQSMWFIMIHIDFHLLFIVHHFELINTPDDIRVCNHLGYMAWRHHYHKSDTFTEFWLRYRMSYFDYRMWAMIALESLVEYSLGFQYWWLNAMFQHTWIHIEAVTHEWYHIPLEKRSTYFHIRPIGWLYFFMEWIGMINTVKHMGHHDHQLTNQLDAEDFFDMWVPSFLLRFADNIWTSTIKKYNLVEPTTVSIDHPQFAKENQEMYHRELTKINLRNYLIASMIGVCICCVNYEMLVAQLTRASIGVFSKLEL